jgi:hypothetical protein
MMKRSTYVPAQLRERQAELERQATRILAADRRRRRRAGAPKRQVTPASSASQNGWRPLTDLRRAWAGKQHGDAKWRS